MEKLKMYDQLYRDIEYCYNLRERIENNEFKRVLPNTIGLNKDNYCDEIYRYDDNHIITVIRNTYNNIKKITLYDLDNKKDNDNKPSEINFINNCVQLVRYFKNGKLNRLDGPAVIKYDDCDFSYYVDNVNIPNKSFNSIMSIIESIVNNNFDYDYLSKIKLTKDNVENLLIIKKILDFNKIKYEQLEELIVAGKLELQGDN